MVLKLQIARTPPLIGWTCDINLTQNEQNSEVPRLIVCRIAGNPEVITDAMAG